MAFCWNTRNSFRKSYPVKVTQAIILLIDKAENAHFIATYYGWNAITSDPGDNKLFDAAVTVNAAYLVTSDSHFIEAQNLYLPNVNITSANEFWGVLVKHE